MHNISLHFNANMPADAINVEDRQQVDVLNDVEDNCFNQGGI